MIEMPEAMTLGRQLEETVKGKKIAKVVANASPHGFAFFFDNAPEAYDGLLSGKEIGQVRSFGGQVEMDVQDARLHFFDGVNVRYAAPGDKLPAKHQLLVTFEDGSSIVCTVQMYGGLQAYPAGRLDDHFYYAVSKEKPSPLSDDFTEDYFGGIVGAAKPSLSAKALLATEQRIPGLGNGCLQDILFKAAIHPKRKVAQMRDAELQALYRSIKETMLAMAQGGGRDTEKDLFGQAGGYRSLLCAKTWKAPCPYCGGELVRQAYLGGNVYFCPICQPMVA